jgi:hypothetical protein
MHSNLISFLSLSALCLLMASSGAYAQKVIPVDTSKTVTIRADPMNAMGGNASEIFESVDYIPLETTQESTFGKIEQLEVTDDRFVILDENTNSILLFKKDGKFVGKIKGGDKKHPSGYFFDYSVHIDGFELNRLTKEIIFSSFDMKTRVGTYHFYDLDGKKIKDVVRGSKDPEFNYAMFIGKNLLVAATNYNDSKEEGMDTRYLIEYVTDLKEVRHQSFPYQVKGLEVEGDILGVASGPLFYFGVDTAVFFVKNYDYNIFKVTPTTVERSYHFIFPLINAIPPDFIYNNAYKGKRMQYLKDHPDAIYGLSNCFLLGDNLTFKATNRTMDFKKQSSMIYNLKSGTLIALGQITTDALSYFLPVADDQMLNYSGFVASDGKYVYSSFPSVVMFQAHETNQDKNIKYNQVLNEYFSKGKKENNPVLVQIKLKDQL